MDIKHLSEDFAVCPQVFASDLAALKKLGFKAIICNRPDGEAPGQPDFAEIASAAKEYGMEAHNLPVTPMNLTAENAARFAELMEELPKPTIAYCRSAARSAALWNMTQPAHEIPKY